MGKIASAELGLVTTGRVRSARLRSRAIAVNMWAAEALAIGPTLDELKPHLRVTQYSVVQSPPSTCWLSPACCY